MSGVGEPRLRRIFARAALRLLRLCAARVPRAPAVEDPPAGDSLFLFKTKPNKKTSENLFGERSDAQRTSPLLLSLSCYLSRPVVWGESARGPTPHQRDLAGGRGPLSWCLGWSVGEPSELGAGARCACVLVSCVTWRLWKPFGVREGQNRPADLALLRMSGI